MSMSMIGRRCAPHRPCTELKLTCSALQNTDYRGYSPTDQVVKWFWEARILLTLRGLPKLIHVIHTDDPILADGEAVAPAPVHDGHVAHARERLPRSPRLRWAPEVYHRESRSRWRASKDSHGTSSLATCIKAFEAQRPLANSASIALTSHLTRLGRSAFWCIGSCGVLMKGPRSLEYKLVYAMEETAGFLQE